MGSSLRTSLKWVVESLAMISASLERMVLSVSMCVTSTALDRQTIPSRCRAARAIATFSGVIV